MQIHDYDRNTGEYLQTREAREDPEETKLAGEPRYLIPAHATTTAPPTPGEYQAPVFRDGAWQLVKDNRGRAYCAVTGEREVIQLLEVDKPTDGVWEEDQVQVSLTQDKAEISADGTDQAVVSVAVDGESPPASIVILVGDMEETVELTDGKGSLPAVIAMGPCAITIRVKDQITYRDNGGCAITAG